MDRVQAVVFGALVSAGALAVRWFDTPHRCGSPQQAARRAEAQAQPLSLVWGKLRGFSRLRGGWFLVYQPGHGAWVVSVVVPDLDRPEPPAVKVAPWLAGARLSLAAAQRMVGDQTTPTHFADRFARRDWFFQEQAVLGALPVAIGFGNAPVRTSWSWAGPLFLALVAAGAVGRRLRPQPPVPVLRRLALLASGVMILALPSAAQLGSAFFVPGVRPFLTLLMVVAAGAMVLGVVGVFPLLFPVYVSRPNWYVVAVGGFLGFLGGLASSPGWALSVAGLPWRWLWLLAAPLLFALLVDVAATGCSLFFAPLGRLAPVFGFLASAFTLWQWGAWGLPLAAAFLATPLQLGQRFWLVLAVSSTFLPGAWWASAGWLGPLRDGLLVMLGFCGFLFGWLLWVPEPLREGATIPRCE